MALHSPLRLFFAVSLFRFHRQTERASRGKAGIVTSASERGSGSESLEASLPPFPNEGEKLASGALLTEDAAHRRGHSGGILLLHAAHHHAQVARLDHHADALRGDRRLDRIRDLLRQPLLHLEAAGKNVD